MTQVRLRLAASTVLAMGLVAVLVDPAHAEYCRPVMPLHARDVRGYTFEARVTAVRVEPAESDVTYITMAVAKVHAKPTDRPPDAAPLVHQTIELYSNPCDGFALFGLEVGSDILMSTYSLEDPVTTNTAVWRRDGMRLHLLDLRGTGVDRFWVTSDRRIDEANTVPEALALVAGAVAPPDTATGPVGSREAPVLLLVGAGLIGLVVSGWRFQPGSGRPERQPEVGGPASR